jgi:hypothetical protein
MEGNQSVRTNDIRVVYVRSRILALLNQTGDIYVSRVLYNPSIFGVLLIQDCSTNNKKIKRYELEQFNR